VKKEKPFEIFAMVLLPDHMHSVWVLPPGVSDFSTRWGDVKTALTKKYLANGGDEAPISKSRRSKVNEASGSAASGNTSFAMRTT
jgi:putative transposase